jgi:outer membrane murein-binding lipoprotein Lpp
LPGTPWYVVRFRYRYKKARSCFRSATVSGAMRERSSEVEQINASLQQLDTVVQKNAGASEEMASMAEELSAQAVQLAESVGAFKTDAEHIPEIEDFR